MVGVSGMGRPCWGGPYEGGGGHYDDLRIIFHVFSLRTVENNLLNEPRHEKTCLCHMRTTKAQISLRICAV